MNTKKVPMAVAVARCSGGNHVLDMRAGAAKATDPDIAVAAELILANLIEYKQKNIRIFHECGATEKSVPRITVWHHEACLVMTNCDPEGRNFLSHPGIAAVAELMLANLVEYKQIL